MTTLTLLYIFPFKNLLMEPVETTPDLSSIYGPLTPSINFPNRKKPFNSV